MKKFLALATMVALIFVGCQDPEPVQPELKLTSQSTMSFTAEGGNGTITYSLTNPVNGTEIEASSSDSFVASFDTATSGSVTFVVAANEATEARSATITVKYSTESFTVTVNQEGAASQPDEPGEGGGDEPGEGGGEEPAADVVFEATKVNGFYYGNGEYEFYVSTVGFDDEGYYQPNAVYFSFVELYAAAPAEDAEAIYVPAGEYVLDLDYTYAQGTFTENSTYFETDADGRQINKQFYAEATLVVAEDGSMEFNATDEDGKTYLMTLPAGDYPFVDESTPAGGEEPDQPDQPEDIVWTAPTVNGTYMGDYYGYMGSNSYTINFTDVEDFDSYGYPASAGKIYTIQFYSDTKPTATPITAPEGVYTFDPEKDDVHGNISSYSYYYETDDDGYFIDGSKIDFVEATLTITAEGMTLEIVDENGVNHTVTFEGAYELDNQSGEEIGGGDQPGEDGAITIEFDEEMVITAEYYGDFIDLGMGNWYIEAEPASGNGWGIWIDAYAAELGFDPELFIGTFVNQYEMTSLVPFYGGGVFEMKDGEETDVEYEFESGDLVVEEGYFGSTSMSISNGNVNFEWMAVLDWVDVSSDEGDEAPAVEVDFNKTTTVATSEFFGDIYASYFPGLDNYNLTLEGADGNYMVLDILTDNKVGANELPSMTFEVGEPDDNTTDLVWAGVMSGGGVYPSFWGLVNANGQLTTVILIEDGEVTITKNDDDTYTIDVDAAGHTHNGVAQAITATYTGEIEFSDETVASAAVSAVKAKAPRQAMQIAKPAKRGAIRR